jgi:hypothetical protein
MNEKTIKWKQSVRMWKEVFAPYFKVLHRNSSEGQGKTTRNIIQGSRNRNKDLHTGAP